jgi:hypothetical protein
MAYRKEWLDAEKAEALRLGIGWYDLTRDQKQRIRAGERVELTFIQRQQYRGPRAR